MEKTITMTYAEHESLINQIKVGKEIRETYEAEVQSLKSLIKSLENDFIFIDGDTKYINEPEVLSTLIEKTELAFQKEMEFRTVAHQKEIEKYQIEVERIKQELADYKYNLHLKTQELTERWTFDYDNNQSAFNKYKAEVEAYNKSGGLFRFLQQFKEGL